MTVLLVQDNAPVAQNGGFAIEALTIKFAGVNEVVQRNGNGNSANNAAESISAFGLQESEAQIANHFEQSDDGTGGSGASAPSGDADCHHDASYLESPTA